LDNAEAYEGRQVDCFGPKDYTYMELAKFVDDITERKFPIVPIPYEILKPLAGVLQYQRDPSLTPDLVDVWAEDFLPTLKPEEYELQTDEATKILTMKDFGIEAKTIEKIMFEWLQSYRFGGHFHRVEGYH
jgi:NADH dehydrogenase (ubiquinone) 1 alpha subcomplex subunit 9